MSYTHLEVEVSRRVGHIRLDRPDKLNALSPDMWKDLPLAVADLNQDDSVRVIVVSGNGRAFTVGIDVEMLAGMGATMSEPDKVEQRLETIKNLQHSFSSLAESPKPVIAAVHGFCLGAGLSLITACDIRIAASDAVLGIRETKLAIVADVGVLQRLPRIVGYGHAAELALTGKDIDASRAAQIGLVNRIVTPDALTTSAGRLAEEMAENSPLVLKGVKRVLQNASESTVEDGLAYVARWNAEHLISHDLYEAMAALVENRSPRFTGS